MSGFRRTLAKDPELDALVMLTVDCRAADELNFSRRGNEAKAI